jgi:hypothetical protein
MGAIFAVELMAGKDESINLLLLLLSLYCETVYGRVNADKLGPV